MNILVVDISGYSPSHNAYLCNALTETGDNINVTLAIPTPERLSHKVRLVRLLNIVPSNWYSKRGAIKNILRGIEVLLNYFYVVIISKRCRYDIIHFQWLPFLEYSSLDLFFVKLCKLLSSKQFIILSIHNIFPHSIPDGKKCVYINRVKNLEPHIDAFISHTEIARNEIIETYGLSPNKVFVTHLGTYPITIENVTKKEKSDHFRIIMYGYHSFYKGTDLLLSAIDALPSIIQKRLMVHIVGSIENDYYDNLKAMPAYDMATWTPYFVEDNVLYDFIINSDLIVLPYRSIAQSGALLTALNFGIPIITSDLPSFKETLFTFDDNMFFKCNDSSNLSSLLLKYLNNEIDIKAQIKKQVLVKEHFTWENTAKQTLEIYNQFN